MRKKLILTVIALTLVCAMLFAFVACDDEKEETPTKTIVYLGDSIAEAIAGPSPLTERENYGYYALIGRRNNYYYYNHSVSGHKTHDMDSNTGLLDMLQVYEEYGYGKENFKLSADEYTENEYLLFSHLKQADIIHISILGNNFLQNDLSKMIAENVLVKNGEMEYENTTMYKIINGGSETLIDEDGESYVARYSNARRDIADIVKRLKDLNPDAVIMFQNVYNPVFEGTGLVKIEDIAAYAAAYGERNLIDKTGAYGEAGARIATVEQFRAIADEMLSNLNGILNDCLADNPGAFYIMDARTAFDNVYKEDAVLGRSLIFYDWVHPSNAGHAVLADLTQSALEELGLADKSAALSRYQQIRKEQLKRMFSYTESAVDINAAMSAINNAESCSEVTRAYFKAIYGVQPQYC